MYIYASYTTVILKKNCKLENHMTIPLTVWVRKCEHIIVYITHRCANVLCTIYIKMNKIGKPMKQNIHQNEWSSSSHQNFYYQEKHGN